jgi:AcrR family transcriptional regulator
MVDALHRQSRTGLTERNDDLIDRAADYVLSHGLANLSIRPLAAALGMSHRTLLYHVGSKDELVVAVLDVIRARDQGRIRDSLGRVDVSSVAGLFRAAWAHFTAPEREAYNRFFHEVLALGLRDGAYRAWVESAIDSRTGMLATALTAMGLPAERGRAGATMLIAAVRGLQLHLLTTGDRALTDAAFDELLAGLDALLPCPPRPPPPSES